MSREEWEKIVAFEKELAASGVERHGWILWADSRIRELEEKLQIQAMVSSVLDESFGCHRCPELEKENTRLRDAVRWGIDNMDKCDAEWCITDYIWEIARKAGMEER